MKKSISFTDEELCQYDLRYLEELIEQGLDYTGILELLLSKLKKSVNNGRN